MGQSKASGLLLFLAIILIFNLDLFGQVNRYVVHLKDKEGTQYSVDNPEAYLSSRAIERRQKQNIDITEEDFPINAEYYNTIRQTSAEVYFSSKWFNAVLVQCDESLVTELESLPFVNAVEYVGPGAKVGLNGKYGSKNRRRNQRTKKVKQEASDVQNNMIGVDALHESGITGAGILIAVMDGGFYGVEDLSPFSHLYDENRIIHTYDYIAGQPDVYLYSNHGTKVFSLLGAYEPDVFRGSAYDSDYMLFVTEDDCSTCEHRVEEYNWAFAAEFADSAGVDVINTSLGYNWFEDPSMDYTQEEMDGNTAVISMASDIAFSKGILVVASAGNEGRNGWGIITAPADAHNVISVGNVGYDGQKSPSSSFGPTADQRIKPDVSALGDGVQVLSPSGSIVSGSGTSFSSPQVAGLCALLLQAYPELTAEEVRFLLLETASNSANPNNEIGYGIPNYNSFDNFITFSDSEQSFLLYPNPVDNDKLVIRVNNPGEIPVVNLQIFNTSGQKMLEENIEFSWQENTQIIDMYSLSSGVYIFNLDTGGNIEKVRVVKI